MIAPQDAPMAAAEGAAAPAPRLDAAAPSSDFLRLIPRDFAREHLILSQGRDADGERLAVSPRTDPAAVFNTGVRLGVPVHPLLADPETIARLIDEAYGTMSAEAPAADVAEELDEGEIERLLTMADRDLLSTEGKGRVARLVDVMLFEALSRGASDIHIQPVNDRTIVRYRLDGVLHTVRELPRNVTTAVISLIKVMGRMDIAERRIPQDGRATVTVGQRSVDLRISTLPTSYGERAAIRILDTALHLNDFDRLGMPENIAQRFLERARRANGIILVTGPTGSGKTTTLYSTLKRVGSPELNILTIEDPIEYDLSTMGLAISQAQVNLRKGVTFATGLRHILRQDPNIVMVGEIRDTETARVAIQASLTGHLVFSTLHTNDAASAVTRLVDLDVEAYLVAASLSAVLAQRLLRTTHKDCNAVGCNECMGTGFLGRAGVFELLVVDEEIRGLIAKGARLQEIRDAAKADGMVSLREAAIKLVTSHRTTLAEAQRVLEGVT